MKSISKLFILINLLFTVHAIGQNLLINGDFEAGGAGTGFTVPNYTLYTSTTGDTYPGSYAISSNPSALNRYFIPSIMDHSPGSGNTMMVIDGSTNANASFWSAGNNATGLCGLTVGSSYTFSYWVRTVSSTTVDATTQPNIVPNFTNATGTIILGNPTIGLPSEDWQQVIYRFVPTGPCVNINLVNINLNSGGNDFILDDLEVSLQLCTPTILSINNPDPVCEPNTVDITLPAVTAGSIGGGTLTYWTDALATLPLTNPASISISGTYYIKSSSGATCSDTKSVAVVIKPTVIPLFTQVNPICVGEVLNPLPIISNNGVVGTWSPVLDNTTTKTYTFTPDSSANPNLVFNGDFSKGNVGFTTDYTNISNSNGTRQGVYGITTNSSLWFSSLSSCLDNSGTGNFMVVDASTTNGGNDKVWCQTIPVTPGENFVFSYYTQSVSSGSPARFEVEINGISIGTNDLDFSTCNWVQNSIPWNSGAATSAEICIFDRNTDSFGNDFGIDDISLTALGIQCANTVDMTITVNPSTTATFAPITPICSGDSLAPLPTTSLEGITGTWSPVLNNMVTTTYTFTPDIGQCASSILTDLTITVTSGTITPTFKSINPICSGDPLDPLPVRSIEGVTGTWFPELDNTVTTTYTFTPDVGQCTSAALTQLTITVNSLITPTFTPITDICSGDMLTPLPNSSLEGITGTWSPALDNRATTLYTFTPDAGQCSDIASLGIIVNRPVVPEFNILSSICAGDTAPVLNVTSLNGITGSWSPSVVDNMSSGDYIFTPNTSVCVVPQTITITVNQPTIVDFSIDIGEAFSGDRRIIVNTSGVSNYEYQLDTETPQLSNVFENVSSGRHTITVSDANGCSEAISKEVLILDYPKFFTPNADGINDNWNINSLANQPDTRIYIYNRYGKLLKEITSMNLGWDGTYKGKNMPSSDYWFVVEYSLDSKREQFKSHFTLKR
ncbi:hypothetical protein A8C32_07755 [Flavivirga aquatica]|uniref:MAM domain-containing protein n=1 Tax=Flavivirga aquatica TaxID=1849968 RepID=A0A1E5SIX5_9FLAO|nr:T9SS type B sorting domain-containing protein [Flavivirga aquatica]OEJ99063.1 hypothetical protein A8C32_07755 [Flavivirga aquatica]